jgi:hypothetical protein
VEPLRPLVIEARINPSGTSLGSEFRPCTRRPGARCRGGKGAPCRIEGEVEKGLQHARHSAREMVEVL